MLADPEIGTLDDIVDMVAYPIVDHGARTDLSTDVRRRLETDGAVTLPGFLTADALTSIGAELERARPYVPIRRHRSTVYARTELEDSLPGDDPRRMSLEWTAGHITRDMIPSYSAAHRLYVSPDFKAFIAACVGRLRIFEYADPLAGLVATVVPPGGRYPWHYDTNEFVVTIMINRPAGGGMFVYRKDLRTPGDENVAGLGRVLTGADVDHLTVTDNAPGDLQLFCGRYSLHQVTEVEGDRDRIVLVLSYAEQPGIIGPLDRTRRVYGRVTEAHLVAAERSSHGSDGLIL